MIKVKHLMDAVESDDGQRLWVESVGLTKDLREWCQVQHVLPHLGPTPANATWFAEHADGYEHFRGQYHEALTHSHSAEVTEPTCVQVFQPGYRIGERIVRPARVGVADPE